MAPKTVLPALVITACLAIAGCGGSGSSSHQVTTSSSVSQASFDATVGSLCKRANSAFGAVKGNKAQAAVIGRYLTVFRSVKVPPKLENLYMRYLGVLDQELSALRHGDSNRVFQLATTKARPLARQLGATGCITS